MSYKHYSFDFWGTLFKSNPEFGEKRNAYFCKYFLERGKKITRDEINDALIYVKGYGNALNLLNGKSINPLEVYALFIFRLTGSLEGISMLEMEIMYREVEKIFLENPPIPYDDTVYVLEELGRRGKTLSILSNTLMSRGSTLRKVLKAKGIYNLFQFTLFSDEMDLSKPNRAFFRELDTHSVCGVKEIVHVGDDETCDGVGASEYGFKCIIINSNSLTIKDLL